MNLRLGDGEAAVRACLRKCSTSKVAALALVMLSVPPAFPADAAIRATNVSTARFGGSVYTGRPKMQTTLSLIVAGGGPADFKATTLVGVLAGPNANAEVAKLTKQYGAKAVTRFITTFDFVVADALRLVKKNAIVLPNRPEPDPSDGKALAAALYTAGVHGPRDTYDVEYMLDRLVSHPLHVAIMRDIDAKYGAAADASYHIGVSQVINDLKTAYSL